MNKLAIFVEGQTESIFAERLLREIAGGGMQIEQREERCLCWLVIIVGFDF